MPDNFNIILLAAGLSSRMGKKNKLLMPFKSQTVIGHVVQELSLAYQQPILVVLGHQQMEVREALVNYEVDFVVNESYSLGMTSSIQKGVANSEEASGFQC